MVRFRRNVGRQTLRPRRLITTICIYSVLSVLIGAGALLTSSNLFVFGGLLVGVLLGAGMGLYGLHLTRFEPTPSGLFYTPNPYMGVALTTLLVARLAYRAMVLSTPASRANAPHAFNSPLTTFLFGLLAGYYVAYYIGVLVRSNETSRPAA